LSVPEDLETEEYVMVADNRAVIIDFGGGDDHDERVIMTNAKEVSCVQMCDM
jgi:hypothetical protein